MNRVRDPQAQGPAAAPQRRPQQHRHRAMGNDISELDRCCNMRDRDEYIKRAGLGNMAAPQSPQDSVGLVLSTRVPL